MSSRGFSGQRKNAENMRVTEKSTRPRRAVASSETAREINRDILLHAIHLHQPVSRADLARLTGLQPSTVSVIIGQLIDEEWVVPGQPGTVAAWTQAHLCNPQRPARYSGHRSAARESESGGRGHQREDPGPRGSGFRNQGRFDSLKKRERPSRILPERRDRCARLTATECFRGSA